MKRQKEKKDEIELEIINRVKALLESKKFVKDGLWTAKEVDVLNNHLFLTSKPVIYLANIGDVQYVKK
jgi:obg-like ATPase 1